MAQKRKSAPRAASKRSQKPIRREIGALVCFFLSVFCFLNLFGVTALFLDFFGGLARRLIGYGFYILPAMLLLAAGILLFHRGRPVRFRVWCALLAPLVFGALWHLFFCKQTYAWSFAMLSALWEDGVNLLSGGVLGGLLALSFSAVFSAVGASIVLIAALLFLALSVGNLSLVKLFDRIFHRPKPPAYTPEPVPQRAPRPVKEPVKEPRHRRGSVDIPLGAGWPEEKPQPSAPSAEEKAELLPPRPEHVRTPAEALGHFPVEDKAPAVAVATGTTTEKPKPTAVKPAAEPKEVKVPPEVPPEHAGQYRFPPVTLLASGRPGSLVDGTEELKGNASRLLETVTSFGIEARIVSVTRGPTVTRYEIELDKGIKLSRLTGLSEDIALALGTSGVRIAPVPDKMSVVGIEVPNKLVSTVYIRDVIDSAEFAGRESKVSFALGKDIGGNAIVGDIAKLTHLLIAGTTGSGKSVCMNSLIVSLLYKASPEEVRLIMIDPKMVELGIYNGIPHLEVPVVTDPKKAAGALQWAVFQMEKRYRLFMERGVRDIFSYNQAIAGEPEIPKMPQIVIVIDELADLMLVAAKEVEESICRIAQKARAAGMHLIIATQRPSADVITGLMKANIPSRIAFAVASQLESRIILDTMGAEKLVGRGDMLFFPLGAPKPTRIQGCLITGTEVEGVVSYVKQTAETAYSEEIMNYIDRQAEQMGNKKGGGGNFSPEDGGDDEEVDNLLAAAVEIVIESGQASVSYLQRRLKLGFSRAARLVDQMEARGIVGPSEGSKPRQLLITRQQWQEIQMRKEDQG